jgi:hypothetical protein
LVDRDGNGRRGMESHESIESFGFFPPLSKRNVINVIETWSERFRT